MSLVTGTVTLSLSEVDSLRDAIKQAEQKISNLEKEKEEIKAEKRILKIHEKQVSYEGALSLLQNFKKTVSGRYGDVINDVIYKIHQYNSHLSYGYIVTHESADKAMYGYTSKVTKTEEYINMDDVKEEMYNKALEKLNAELSELRIYKQESMNILAQKEARLNILFQEKEQKKDEEYKLLNKKYIALEEEFNDLKNDKVRISKEQALQKQINDLAEELRKEKNKKWYHKLI